jgi:hypothetical protein
VRVRVTLAQAHCGDDRGQEIQQGFSKPPLSRRMSSGSERRTSDPIRAEAVATEDSKLWLSSPSTHTGNARRLMLSHREDN